MVSYQDNPGTWNDLITEYKRECPASMVTLESQLDHEFRIQVEEIGNYYISKILSDLSLDIKYMAFAFITVNIGRILNHVSKIPGMNLIRL